MEDAVIAVEAVDKRFGPPPILRQATLAVPRSQTCGIVGVNGSGKTTLLRCLVGLIRPNAGRVAVLGQEVYPQLGPLPRGLGAVIEQPAFLGSLTGWRNLELLASLVPGGDPRDRRAAALEQVGLDPANRVKLRSYSLGMRQRLALAQAIMEAPSLLILDEPQYGLDPEGVAMLRGLLHAHQAAGGTTLMVSHHLDEVAAVVRRGVSHGAGPPRAGARRGGGSWRVACSPPWGGWPVSNRCGCCSRRAGRPARPARS